MEWLLGGPSAGWLVDDPERNFSDEEDGATTPLQYYLRHGYGPCPPSPTPSDEDPEHFAPPGHAAVTNFFQPPPAVHADALPPGLAIDVAAAAHVVPELPDLNLPAPDAKEKAEDTTSSASLPTPSPEARVLLRRFASAMAARPAGIRAGTWSPAKLGLTDRLGVLRLDDASKGAGRS
uniref:Uncharacterized protein n=1 Tax=Avena sativa TaxID=4498 RepID=A0ACD5UXA9_AVESA